MHNFRTRCGLTLVAIYVGGVACGARTEFADLASSESTVGGQISLPSSNSAGTSGVGGTSAITSTGGETSLSAGGTVPFSATGGTSAHSDDQPAAPCANCRSPACFWGRAGTWLRVTLGETC